MSDVIERLQHNVSAALDEMGERWPNETPMVEWSVAWRRAWDAIDALVREAENEALERAARALDRITANANAPGGNAYTQAVAVVMGVAAKTVRALAHPSAKEDAR